MARIRTFKPEFFTSEDIVELSPLARLLYMALWCEADREGRLEWKPKTFKIRYLPMDNCDIDALCREILERKLVVLYGDGLAYIPTFLLHQHINPRESKSVLPEPKNTTRRARVSHASAREDDAQGGKEGKGRERNTTREDASRRVVLEPPTLEEAKAYALEHWGLNSTFAADFIRDNAAKDWRDKAGKPYENWKLVMSTWVRTLKKNGDLSRYAHKVDTSIEEARRLAR